MEFLAAKRILLTRAAEDHGPWIERLSSLGAEAVPHPCILIEALDLTADWRDKLNAADWIAFTSFRAVLRFADLLGSGTLAAHLIAAVGPTTRAACLDRFGRCDLSSTEGSGASLAAALTPRLTASSSVLLPGAADPRPELAEALSAVGASAVPLPLYATRPTTKSGPKLDLRNAKLDAALFASPSAISGAFATATLPLDLPAACIGPTTAQAARAAGLTKVTTSKTRDLDGLLSSLAGHLTPTPQER